MSRLREVTASGTPEELGIQHGEAARDLIRTGYAARMGRASATSDEADVLKRAIRYQDPVERFAPELLEEVDGIATGAKLTFEQVFFLQVATELELVARDGCSSLGSANAVGGPFLAQNWDQPPGTYETQILLRLKPVDQPDLMMFTRAGVIGYIGVNSSGVGYVNNQLYAPSPVGLTGYFITRKFLGCESVTEAIAWLRGVDVGSAGNYLLGDASGTIVDVELGDGRFEEITRAVQGHTNHFLSPSAKAIDRAGERLPDSYDRYERVAELFTGSGDLDLALRVLRDHQGYPKSICRHEEDSGIRTVASVIIKLREREMLICDGNPCEREFVPYPLDPMG